MKDFEKEKLRSFLYNKKCIFSMEKIDSFVGIYFEPLVDLIDTFVSRATGKSKFEETDYIVGVDKTVYKVLKALEKSYLVMSLDGVTHTVEQEATEDYFHKWTIADAVDGDILSDGYSTFIFKEIGKDSLVCIYCEYNYSDKAVQHFHKECDFYASMEEAEDFHPATDEEIKLFKEKIAEKGYRWDAEKKVLLQNLSPVMQKAVDTILELTGGDSIICERIHSLEGGCDWCEKNCLYKHSPDENCVLKYLEEFSKKKNKGVGRKKVKKNLQEKK